MSRCPSSCEDTYCIGFQPHSNPVWPHLNLVTYIKTLYPNTVTFTNSRWMYFLGDTIHPNTGASVAFDNFLLFWGHCALSFEFFLYSLENFSFLGLFMTWSPSLVSSVIALACANPQISQKINLQILKIRSYLWNQMNSGGSTLGLVSKESSDLIFLFSFSRIDTYPLPFSCIPREQHLLLDCWGINW